MTKTTTAYPMPHDAIAPAWPYADGSQRPGVQAPAHGERAGRIGRWLRGCGEALVRLTRSVQSRLAHQALVASADAAADPDDLGGRYLNDASGGGWRDREALRCLHREEGQGPRGRAEDLR